MMREKFIEKKLVEKVKAMHGMSPKLITPGLDGVPDRLVLLAKGKVGFVEIKAPGRLLRPLQVKRKSQLESLGFLVYCVDSVEEIGGVLDEICST